ncbi:unnamed protein product [Lactuca virosa]|uniref:Uncharacterized protein n=1 Tax=Lactuca virosa TaxID=75947 RepID=A0AAU9MNU8_9ASTR|nr:unnamed protein product [Lactuca virosa]
MTMVKQMRQGIQMTMATLIFFKKDNEVECEMSDNVSEGEPVNDDMGENEDDEADVDIDLPNIFNEEQA